MKPVYVFQSRRIAKDAEDYWKARLTSQALGMGVPLPNLPPDGKPNHYDSKRNDRTGREDDEKTLVTLRTPDEAA